MALEQKVSTQLQLIFQVGLDEEGNMMLKNKNFNNVKTDATADQLFAVASVLEPLQERTLHGVERNDSSIVVSS
ncbi:hypothetical protein HNQ94_003323 [Salirhabdus euzebyi]|uniref:DUF1659 domain-containing protein n=1 Tax=Salirhabdus euzebyi TaxID=394506 RepID=A0A841Q947_9BACI|nr:DUF1659 domain-containing protein [Salirhabdus euzebyi]MBB6454834.1 hypothetical protein [Salirhabdus euzebyi]